MCRGTIKISKDIEGGVNMTLEELLIKIKIDSDTGIYLEGKFMCSIFTLMRLDYFYKAYAHLVVDTIAIDDVYNDKLKITLKG